MSNGTMRPPRPAAQPVNEPLKHVIAEYKHQAQTITCVCGWHGKSSSPDGRTSEWTAHLAADSGRSPADPAVRGLRAATVNLPRPARPRRSFDSRASDPSG